jgi:hypothetical protein
MRPRADVGEMVKMFQTACREWNAVLSGYSIRVPTIMLVVFYI